jgi:hypothetical protein
MRRSVQKPRESAEKPDREIPKPTNPYALALITATLAGFFSVVGGYLTANFQARHAIPHKQLEYRVSAYSAFLDKTNRNKEPAISQILNIGTIVDHLTTDGEIQAFEDRIAELLTKYDVQELHWKLNADLNILRLHGSNRVVRICEDLLKALLLRDSEIIWADDTSEVVALHESWKVEQGEVIAYGWAVRVSEEERLMIITIAKLMQALIQQLRIEIHDSLI